MRRIAAVCVACTVVASGFSRTFAQSGAKNGEWPTYGADLGHTRYSPLEQIDASNFKNLDVAWRFKPDNLGARPEFQFESQRSTGGRALVSSLEVELVDEPDAPLLPAGF